MVVFDLAGVIFTEPHIITNLLYPMLPQPKNYSRIKERYEKYKDGKITNKEFWNGVKNYKVYEKSFLEKFKLDLYFFSVVNYLKEKYRLAILSNLPLEWAEYLIHKFNLNAYFNPIVVSGKVKVSKPNRTIYLILQKKSNIPFEEIIFIDDRKKNLKVAKQLGMKTIWFKKEDDEFEFEPDYTINSLIELKKIL